MLETRLDQAMLRSFDVFFKRILEGLNHGSNIIGFMFLKDPGLQRGKSGHRDTREKVLKLSR